MLDFSRVSEALTGLMGSPTSPSDAPAELVSQLLERAGVDPSLLDGLTAEEATSLLQNAGIDPSLLSGHPLGEALSNGSIGEQVASFLGDRLKG